jgi:hypothetical protein
VPITNLRSIFHELPTVPSSEQVFLKHLDAASASQSIPDKQNIGRAGDVGDEVTILFAPKSRYDVWKRPTVNMRPMVRILKPTVSGQRGNEKAGPVRNEGSIPFTRSTRQPVARRVIAVSRGTRPGVTSRHGHTSFTLVVLGLLGALRSKLPLEVRPAS